MSNTVKGYFEPSSTKVHSNIDDLILQAELDKRQFGGVSYYKGMPILCLKQICQKPYQN